MLVANKDKVLSVETIGFSNFTTKQPMPVDAVFGIASMTKPITATALMMLVDEGKVNVDDPVAKYIPEFADVKIGNTIKDGDSEKLELTKPKQVMRVRHLLTMTSGMGNSGADLYRRLESDPEPGHQTVGVWAREWARLPLAAEPGTKFMYIASNWTAAARIVEVASGMTFTEFLDRRLFDPLGMKDTTFFPDQGQLSRKPMFFSGVREAQRQKEQEEKLKSRVADAGTRTPTIIRAPSKAFLSLFPRADTGLVSTAADIGKFCQMFLNGGSLNGHRFLKKATVKKMLSRQTGTLKQSYGFGWWVHDDINRSSHGGATGGRMTIDKKYHVATVWMVDQPLRPEEAVKAFENAAVRLYGQPK
jgi:CubicO group peptidase (beta-lactamase class C family)